MPNQALKGQINLMNVYNAGYELGIATTLALDDEMEIGVSYLTTAHRIEQFLISDLIPNVKTRGDWKNAVCRKLCKSFTGGGWSSILRF